MQQSPPKIYAHFFLQKEIDNPRSGEKGILDYEEYRLLPSDWLKLEEPDHCLAQWNFEGLKAWGDSWQDEFRSLRNLIHQLHSLHTVTEAALADGTEVCLFCRPDLRHRRTPIRHQPGKPSRKLEFQTVQFPGGRAGEPGAVSSNPMSFVNQEGYADKLRKLLSLSASGVLLAKLSAWMESARNKECAG